MKQLKKLNRPTTRVEIRSRIKYFPTKKSSRANGFILNSVKSLKRSLVIHKLLKTTERESILPNSFYDVCVTLIPKKLGTQQRKENSRSISLMNIDAENINEILRLQQYIRHIIYDVASGFPQFCFCHIV